VEAALFPQLRLIGFTDVGDDKRCGQTSDCIG
jgi:hypothetical protein